jgi:hypothetical protein
VCRAGRMGAFFTISKEVVLVVKFSLSDDEMKEAKFENSMHRNGRAGQHSTHSRCVQHGTARAGARH